MCPDDYALAAFLDKKLSESEEKKIEEHLNHCVYCMEKILFLKKAYMKEKLFMKEKILLALTIKFSELGLTLIKKSKNLRTEQIEQNFRDSSLKESLIKVFFEEQNLTLRKNNSFIEISCSKPIELEIQNEKGRILFSGNLNPEMPLSIPNSLVVNLIGKNQQMEIVIQNV